MQDAYVKIGENWQSIWREHLALVSRRDEVFTFWLGRSGISGNCVSQRDEAENHTYPTPLGVTETGCFVLTIPALYWI